MRYIVMLSLLLCVLLSACEFITPSTSNALSQTRQEEELAKQTKQIKQQTEALERLTDSVEKLVAPQVQ